MTNLCSVCAQLQSRRKYTYNLKNGQLVKTSHSRRFANRSSSFAQFCNLWSVSWRTLRIKFRFQSCKQRLIWKKCYVIVFLICWFISINTKKCEKSWIRNVFSKSQLKMRFFSSQKIFVSFLKRTMKIIRWCFQIWTKNWSVQISWCEK